MGFDPIPFIIFMLGSCLLYYIIPRSVRVYWLLACSYIFYLYNPANVTLIAFLLIATAVTWITGLALEKFRKRPLWARRLLLAVPLAVCLGGLAYFKYYGFLAESVSGLLGAVGVQWTPPIFDIGVPLGISYFTFQSLGYVMDIYRSKYRAERDPLLYALFVSFFPCIVTGPIERGDHLLPQLRAGTKFNYNTFTGGAFRILLGFFKKIVISDTLGGILSQVFGDFTSYSGPVLAICSLLFAYQLYCDFSASCDIAIGAGACLGFEITENFHRPLAAATFTDLWRRWHISLTRWFRDYIYIPLGGNRKGKLRTYLNTLIVFLVSGLWHGASWNYAVWGLLNGGALCVGKATAPMRQKWQRNNPLFTKKYLSWFTRCVRTAFSYTVFAACLVFFCVDLYGGTISTAFTYYGQLFTGWGGGSVINTFAALGVTVTNLYVLGGGILLTELLEMPKAPVNQTIRRLWLPLRWVLYYALLLGILFFGAFGQSIYIYQAY